LSRTAASIAAGAKPHPGPQGDSPRPRRRKAPTGEEKAYQLYLAADAINDADLRKTRRVFADVEKGHEIKVQKLYDDHVYTEN